jgi:uncharacterized protein (TIGR03067 family)
MFLSKLKVAAVGLLALLVAVAVTVAGARQAHADKKEPVKDEEAILGTWVLESIEEGGMKGGDRFKDTTLTFTADGKIMSKLGGQEQSFTYSLSPGTSLKEFTAMNDQGRTLRGIYKLAGDTLTVCFDRNGNRPDEFSSPEGTTIVLEVLKREKK